ncbi:MAG: hypothetical protein U0359_17240 [Byssovorax sp.]
MRATSLLALALASFSLTACDDDKKPAGASPTAAATVEAPKPSAAPPASTPAPVNIPPPPMPPRPVPIGSSGPIQPSAPQEQQMMAISYTLAMVTPRGNDPPTVDKDYLEDITHKLEAAVRTADKGKTPPNPVKATKGNRKIEVEMGKGCTDKVPSNLIAQRAGSSLKAAYDAGVLVIACHDDKWECHQSTRDPNDVLCHAAPRH